MDPRLARLTAQLAANAEMAAAAQLAAAHNPYDTQMSNNQGALADSESSDSEFPDNRLSGQPLPPPATTPRMPLRSASWDSRE